MFKQMEKGAYSNFDPTVANKFDPDNYNNADGESSGAGTGVVVAKPGQKMQINLVLDNPTASDIVFELFSYLDSMTRRLKSEYAVGTYLYIPMSSFQGLRRVVANTGGVVGFDQAGALTIHGNDTVPDPIATAQCKEIAYAGFFEASATCPFIISFIRFTCETDAQIDQNITYFKKSFSGGITENTVSPRAYFRPNQFQNRTIDITVELSIGIDKGIRTTLLAGESVRLALFIQMWTNQTLS